MDSITEELGGPPVSGIRRTVRVRPFLKQPSALFKWTLREQQSARSQRAASRVASERTLPCCFRRPAQQPCVCRLRAYSVLENCGDNVEFA
jgi:hypothetical protein